MAELTQDLFQPEDIQYPLTLAPGAWLLCGFASDQSQALVDAVHRISADADFRHFKTPGGLPMSVASTNCGTLGWVSDRRGYRYESCDPLSGKAWPALPEPFAHVAADAAATCGFSEFTPDACLINRYEPGSRMTLHQDRDERDFNQPIVSVSLGLPAVFLFGGARRSEKPLRVPLRHGDVVVWGGPARLRFHGVLPLKTGRHDLTGAARINLTFRRAGP